MTGKGFEVRISALAKAQADYQAHCAAVADALDEFQSGGRLPGGAFGELCGSDELESSHQRLCDQVGTHIDKLHACLADVVDRLGMVSANYGQAESASTLTEGRILR